MFMGRGSGMNAASAELLFGTRRRKSNLIQDQEMAQRIAAIPEEIENNSGVLKLKNMTQELRPCRVGSVNTKYQKRHGKRKKILEADIPSIQDVGPILEKLSDVPEFLDVYQIVQAIQDLKSVYRWGQGRVQENNAWNEHTFTRQISANRKIATLFREAQIKLNSARILLEENLRQEMLSEIINQSTGKERISKAFKVIDLLAAEDSSIVDRAALEPNDLLTHIEFLKLPNHQEISGLVNAIPKDWWIDQGTPVDCFQELRTELETLQNGPTRSKQIADIIKGVKQL